MQRVGWRAFEAELRVPRCGGLIDRLDEKSADADQLTGLQNARDRVEQERAPQVLALVAEIDREASEEHDGHLLVARETS